MIFPKKLKNSKKTINKIKTPTLTEIAAAALAKAITPKEPFNDGENPV